MQKLSQRFKDRPLTPQQSVVYWTEYVIKHRGAAHMRTVAADMPFYQYLFLDVIFFVGTLLALLLYTLYVLISLGCRLKTKLLAEGREKVE